MRPLWMILGPFLFIVVFAGLAATKVFQGAACDGFHFDSRAWRDASTSSRLGERSAKWRIAQQVADCDTLDHDSRQAVLLRLGEPGAQTPTALRWEVGDGGVLVVRLRGGRVTRVKGPT